MNHAESAQSWIKKSFVMVTSPEVSHNLTLSQHEDAPRVSSDRSALEVVAEAAQNLFKLHDSDPAPIVADDQGENACGMQRCDTAEGGDSVVVRLKVPALSEFSEFDCSYQLSTSELLGDEGKLSELDAGSAEAAGAGRPDRRDPGVFEMLWVMLCCNGTSEPRPRDQPEGFPRPRDDGDGAAAS